MGGGLPKLWVMYHPYHMSSAKGEKAPAFEVSSGITLSRSVIPTLPPNYLTRKHLFPLLENPSPSTTVVLAPPGYGKTSLVAEWAHTRRDRVIWVTLTESDTLPEMGALFIQATRNILPGFAPWFEAEPGVRPVENVRRWGNELLKIGGEFILVIDNLRPQTARDVDIAVRLIEQFPPNLHFVTIRQDSIETVYATFSSRGPLSVIGAKELSFSSTEIGAFASMMNLSLEISQNYEFIESAKGWPAAVSLLFHQMAKGGESFDISKILSSQTEPLSALATSIVLALDHKTRSMVTSLSVVEEFTHEQAEIILGEEYSYDLINQTALEGHFFTQSGNPEQTFIFSKLMREVLLVELRKDKFKKMRIHGALLKYHEKRDEPNMALENAYLAGDIEKFQELFPDAARVLHYGGRGELLIRWAGYVGDNSKVGLLRRDSIEINGQLTALNFPVVLTMVQQMNADAEGTELEGAIRQLTYRAKAYVDFSLCRFKEFDQSFEVAIHPTTEINSLGIEAQLYLLRLAAMRHFIFDDLEKVESLLEKSKVLAVNANISQTHLAIYAIGAMVHFLQGDYRRAYEAASSANLLFTRKNITGAFAPLESIYIMARCQLQFNRPVEAFELFGQLRVMAETWQQWPWYFFADGYFARDLSFHGKVGEALENISNARDKAALFNFPDDVHALIDVSEIYIRYRVNDFNRLGELLARTPRLNFVEQIRQTYEEKMGLKPTRIFVENLPERTPREKIWKYLSKAEAVIDQEQMAKRHLKSALEIGATVGAKESFLRQSNQILHLIMRIAIENPTVYLEDLSRNVAERLKNHNYSSSDLGSRLTKRELEILKHLSTDRPISAIASTLHISLNTMKSHLKNLYRKLEVDGRDNAVEVGRTQFIL